MKNTTATLCVGAAILSLVNGAPVLPAHHYKPSPSPRNDDYSPVPSTADKCGRINPYSLGWSRPDPLWTKPGYRHTANHKFRPGPLPLAEHISPGDVKSIIEEAHGRGPWIYPHQQITKSMPTPTMPSESVFPAIATVTKTPTVIETVTVNLALPADQLPTPHSEPPFIVTQTATMNKPDFSASKSDESTSPHPTSTAYSTIPITNDIPDQTPPHAFPHPHPPTLTTSDHDITDQTPTPSSKTPEIATQTVIATQTATINMPNYSASESVDSTPNPTITADPTISITNDTANQTPPHGLPHPPPPPPTPSDLGEYDTWEFGPILPNNSSP